MIGKNSSFKLKNIQITQPVRDIHVIYHSAVKITFSLTKHQKRKGYWKLNNSVLKDVDYISGIDETINSTMNTYLKLDSDQLIWESLKVNIK